MHATNAETTLQRRTVNSLIHESQLDPSRLIRRIKSGLLGWVGSGWSRTREKLLKRLVSARGGLSYGLLEDTLGVSRRYVKRLTGELRRSHVVATPGNPASVVWSKEIFYIAAVEAVRDLDPEWVETVTGGGDPSGSPPMGGGSPPPSGDAPEEQPPPGGLRQPPPSRPWRHTD
jgi:hypothetical protein